MSYTKTVGSYRSADKKTEIRYYVFTPEALPTAILQISHGMCDYIERYEESGFVSAMTDAGILVCGNDHLGHGDSILGESELGYFEDYGFLVEDLHTLNGVMRKTYPRLPYVLLGQGAGSLVAREYAVMYSDAIDGAVFSGTSAGNQPLGMITLLASLTAKLRGDHYRSKLLYNRFFSGYNKGFSSEKDPNSWLTSDAGEREHYAADPKTSFLLTATAYREVFRLLSEVSNEEWAQKVPLSLPVLLLAGEDDPFGENGEGVKEVFRRLEDVELNELKIKLYEKGRHELFRDTARGEVCADLVEWVQEVADGVVACRSYGSIPFGKVDFSNNDEEKTDGN